MRIPESELILNPDGSIYHLNLLPEELANTVITVGDPERVKKVSSHFDRIELKKEKREFHTHTGEYKGKRISVISTGIGTDNIDIVFNELDALVNINLKTREIKDSLTSLNIVRIGTSGCLDGEVPVDSTLLSRFGLGLDGLMGFYAYNYSEAETQLIKELNQKNSDFIHQLPVQAYFSEAGADLFGHFNEGDIFSGITATCTGFYAPQGRQLRLQPKFADILDQLTQLQLSQKVTNFEMETAGIYGMANLLGHQALSVNLLIANRATKQFSPHPKKSMDKMIEWTLEKIKTL